MPRLSPETLALYRDCAAKGLGYAETGRLLGVCHERVRQVSRAYGIEFRTRRGRLIDLDAKPFRQARACECGDHGFVGLTKGFVAFVDATDAPLLAGIAWQASPGKRTVYAQGRPPGSKDPVPMHRVILGCEAIVDHRDGDGLNNRRGNLRPADVIGNARNKRMAKSATHGLKGIWAEGGRFRASITVNGKVIRLGYFGTPEEAARAYDAAAIQHFGQFAKTNAMLGLLPQETAL